MGAISLLGIATGTPAGVLLQRSNDSSPSPAAIFVVLLIIGVLAYKLTRKPDSELRNKYAWYPGKTVTELVEDWPAKRCETEAEYERQLADFLRTKLGGFARVRQQQGAGSSRCDIQIDKKVALELKVNLTSTSKLQRLIGQVELYKKESEAELVIVLIGETRSDLQDTLEEHLGDSEKIFLVTK